MTSLPPESPATSLSAKPWFDLLSCAFAALVTGLGVVVAFVGALSVYGSADDILHSSRRPGMTFPENTAALQAATDQLARDGAALSRLEPAAGNKSR